MDQPCEFQVVVGARAPSASRGRTTRRRGAYVARGGTVILHCYRLPLAAISWAAIDCHCLGICTVILLSSLSFSVQMTVSPSARGARLGCNPRRGGGRAAAASPRTARAAPRDRSHRRFRNRCSDSHHEYGIKRMHGRTKRQCDRSLAAPPGLPRGISAAT